MRHKINILSNKIKRITYLIKEKNYLDKLLDYHHKKINIVQQVLSQLPAIKILAEVFILK
jgi:hypothetical protein